MIHQYSRPQLSRMWRLQSRLREVRLSPASQVRKKEGCWGCSGAGSGSLTGTSHWKCVQCEVVCAVRSSWAPPHAAADSSLWCPCSAKLKVRALTLLHVSALSVCCRDTSAVWTRFHSQAGGKGGDRVCESARVTFFCFFFCSK